MRIPIVLLSLVSLIACADPSYTELKGIKQLRNPDGLAHIATIEEVRSEGYINFSKKMNAFSAKLSEIIAKRQYESGKNYTISPLSIELCLGLAIRAANGQTRQELLTALDMDYDSFNTNYKIFYNYLCNETINNMNYQTSQLLLTNSIWIDDEITLKDDGLDALKDDYYSHVFYADFNNQNKAANQAIRDFNKEKTKGLIDQDLNISPNVLFVLMNTLYLKDIWNEDGIDLPYASNSYRFKNSDQSYSNKKLLLGDYNRGKAIDTNDYSSFFTKTDSGYNLYFIKAKDGKSIKNVFNKETITYVTDYNNYVIQDDEKLERYYTNCIFPEYDVETNVDLKKTFVEDFNVNTLFSSACDLSNISDDSVFCSDFKHVAKLKVDKKGIEGAAVTHMAYAGAVGPDEYTDVYENFVVDQEFGFILSRGQNVVFSGIITNID